MNRPLFFFIFLLLLPGLLLPTVFATGFTAEQIMERVDQTLSAAQDQEMRVKLVITDAKGNISQREMVMMQKGNDRRMVKFLAPPEQRGIAFLSLPGGLNYLYLPAYRQTRRIASHVRNQKFAGTDFTYEDMEARKYSVDWEAKLLGEEDGLYCLELIPKAKTNTDYGRLVVEVKADIFFPVKIEFFDKGNKPHKVMVQDKLEQINGYWVAREAEMKDLQAGTSSQMFFTEVKFDSGLADEIFTERYLAR
ncbi:MAG TPA: outer membrane lipoprotein-sorting protein [Firmicutes bacterium]|nr:outer membrane lipoprotein-sorting protein [Bacillota bacterium]